MSFLTPLGLLGLIGLIVWLIIFIIKPNYQKKIISTTYVWKRSLKFRKKRLPTSKLRSILMIICQILAIISISAAMAQPFIAAPDEYMNEKIIILDASCDMLTTVETENGEENRFERAIAQILKTSESLLDADGIVTVILADSNPSYVVKQAGKEQKQMVLQEVQLLMDVNDYRCTYGVADMEAAMVLVEKVLETNPKAEVEFYTGTSYTDAGNVTVVNVSDQNEWNCAILGANVETVENFYEFSIEVAAYGRDTAVEVYLDIYGVNEDRGVRNFHESVVCTQEMGSVTLTFGNDQRRAAIEENYFLQEIYSYEYAYVHIEHNDSLQCDNTLYLYGGTRPVLKIQYYSTLPNPFFSAALRALRDTVSSQWEIQLTEVRDTVYTPAEPALEGFDVYIFEHTIPSILPTDGLVILSDPDSAPAGSGFYLGTSMKSGSEIFLSAGDATHPLMSDIDADNISLTKLTAITNYGADFLPLLYCEQYPVLLASVNPENKMVVMPFSLNNSNLPLVKEFPTLLLNLLDYYVPGTLEGFLYEVNDEVKMNARSPKLDVVGPGVTASFEVFPNVLYVTEPGVYTLSQTPISGKMVIESFYVKVPAAESNIRSVVDTLENPNVGAPAEALDQDLVYFVAMLLVALLFCEWLLQLKEYF